MVSIFKVEPDFDPATKKKIVLTRRLGIPVVLAFAVIMYASLFMERLPEWVGAAASAAEGFAALFVIGRLQSLRNRGS